MAGAAGGWPNGTRGKSKIRTRVSAAGLRQHEQNFRLWHEEDIARSPAVTDADLAAVKRAIDDSTSSATT